MTDRSQEMDVRRRAGWLPEDQDDLEAWLAGHRERVEAGGEQVVLHQVLEEFQELIDSDPVVRLYLNAMIDQVAEFALQAIPQPHDPDAPLVHVRSKLATAHATA